MQCRCKKIVITRRVVNRISDPDMREICRLLMAGFGLAYVRERLELPCAMFSIYIEEIKQLLLDAELVIRRSSGQA
jgi:hypothetical protein